MLDRAALRALHALPKNTVSRIVGRLSEIELPAALREPVNGGFARVAGIDLDESARPPGDYASVNAFFTRRLAAGAREVDRDEIGAVVSPADGRLSHFGKLDSETLVQAKGREYRLVDLVDSGREAMLFKGGSYATIYLSPRDYHRVHAPTRGRVTRVSYIPGQLFPVNPFAVGRIDDLFAVNERLISYLETESLGTVGVVMVGATCVGRMSLAFHECVTNQRFRRREDFSVDAHDITLDHGDELGMFNLGSTVVLLIGAPGFEFDPSLKLGQTLKMGDRLGHDVGSSR